MTEELPSQVVCARWATAYAKSFLPDHPRTQAFAAAEAAADTSRLCLVLFGPDHDRYLRSEALREEAVSGMLGCQGDLCPSSIELCLSGPSFDLFRRVLEEAERLGARLAYPKLVKLDEAGA